MTILILPFIGLLIISLMLELSSNTNINEIGFELSKCSLAGLFICFIIEIINVSKPSAMDVYQGKTTIEIIYKDGIAVDSVVVFKNKDKNNEKLYRYRTE